MLEIFKDLNREWCLKFLRHHPLDRKDINKVYVDTVASYLKDDMVIYDIGGGKNCRYKYKLNPEKHTVYALDISEEELEKNSFVREKIVCDVVREIPTPYGKVDMITSSSVVEHLTDPSSYYENAYKALKDGGVMINMFPCRYALFAIINRILPKDFSKKLLFHFQPGAKKNCGFPAYYEGLYYTNVKRELKKQGFRVKTVYLRYLQADYYTFFAPLFLINYAWDFLMKECKVQNGCSHMMVVAEK